MHVGLVVCPERRFRLFLAGAPFMERREVDNVFDCSSEAVFVVGQGSVSILEAS